MRDPRIGAPVVLRAPWALRGRPGIVRRRAVGGWEIEVRSAAGTPMHLVVPARRLRAPERKPRHR